MQIRISVSNSYSVAGIVGKIVAILFLIVAVGALVYLARSGSLGQFSSLGEDFNLNLDLSSTDFAPPEGYGGKSVGVEVAAPAPSSAGETAPTSAGGAIRAPEGFSEDDLSPFFGKVRISSASVGSLSFYGQIVLSASFGGEGKVNISGWELRGNRGGQFVPQAVVLYDPSGLSPEGNILLGSGESLTLYTTASAIGRNLRLNKCLGYLEDTNKFTPSLPQSCPALSSEPGVSSFSGECQDYVRSLSACRLPRGDFKVPEYDYTCETFLKTVNYKGCFERHRSDSDFLSRDWWAWTGWQFLDERHDRILLLDKSGKLVDVYSY